MTVEAGEGYTELLSWLDEYLADYTVTGEAKNKIEVGEKRIGAPTIIRVKNGGTGGKMAAGFGGRHRIPR